MPAPKFWLDPDESDFPAPPDVPWRPTQYAKPLPVRRRMTAPGRLGFLTVWVMIILVCLGFWLSVGFGLRALLTSSPP